MSLDPETEKRIEQPASDEAERETRLTPAEAVKQMRIRVPVRANKKLRTIIDHGLGESANPTKPYMPVWGAVISDSQVGDLVSYIRAGLPAVPTATPPEVPQGQGAAVEGATLYVVYGCINCHGPNGLGGVPNPQSPDKTIPPLSGADFRGQFNTDAKIADVIRSGSVIGKAPIVSMPHWGGILSNKQLSQLVAYLHTLK